MMAVPIERLRTDLEALYLPPFGAPSTWRKIRQVLDEMARYAGVRETSDLTPPAVGKWLRAFPDRSPATARTLLSSFRVACSYSVRQGWLHSSPFDQRKLRDWLRDYDPDEDDPPQRHHSIVDLCRVLGDLQRDAAVGWKQHRLFALASITAMTGARAKEVQAAQVADFDLVERVFFVRPNARRRLKTRRSKRRVPLTGESVKILADWLPITGSVWAFPGARMNGPWIHGGPGYRPLDELKAAGERSGVNGLTFLSLRHSFITHSAGPWQVPDLISQRIAGHTSRKTTDGYRGFDRENVLSAVASISFGLTLPKEGEKHGQATGTTFSEGATPC